MYSLHIQFQKNCHGYAKDDSSYTLFTLSDGCRQWVHVYNHNF